MSAEPRRGRSYLAGMIFVVLVCIVPLFVGLGDFDLDNDEAIYAYGVDSIVYHGQWQTPWLSPGRGPHIEKPPLEMWIVAAGISFLGLPHDEFGFRIFSVLFAALAFLYLYDLAARRADWLAGVVTVLTLYLFLPLVVEHGLRAHAMEAPLFLAYCGGVWHWLAWGRATPGSRRALAHLLAFTAYFALGFLCKFVAAIFLPAVVGLATLLDPAARHRLRTEWRLFAIAAGAGLLVIAPWFIAEHLAFGAYFWQTILGAHVVDRFTTYLVPEHVQPFDYYFRTLYAELRPYLLVWVFVALGLGVYLTELRRKKTAEEAATSDADQGEAPSDAPPLEAWTLVLWAVLPIVAISFGSSKLIHYLYPFVPPFALFAGRTFGLAFAQLRAPLPGAKKVVLIALFGGALLLQANAWASQWRVMQGRPTDFQRLKACFAREQPKTVLDEGRRETVTYIHLFHSDSLAHTLPYYLNHASLVQQLDKPDDVLLFFRLWTRDHRSAVLISDVLWSTFQENLADPAFRARIQALADRLGNRAEVDALLAGPLEKPPKIRFYDRFDLLLPGPYAPCAAP